jgi:hypothetical protein
MTPAELHYKLCQATNRLTYVMVGTVSAEGVINFPLTHHEKRELERVRDILNVVLTSDTE